MAPKKKPERNAFYFFMQHFRRDMEFKGQRFGNMAEVSRAAGPRWSAMSFDEKAPFEELAKQARIRDSANLSQKFTTTGISFAQLEREENERRELERKMLQEIEQTVRSQDAASGLLRYPFYFAHVNYYCAREGTYYPCEIGIARFTLRKGINDTIHTLIQIDRIPIGYQYEATKYSEDTHGIPVPPEFREGESDYYKLLVKVRSFLMEGRDEDNLPPLYTLPVHIEPVANVLDFLLNSSGVPLSAEFRVYPLTNLFFELRNACASHAGYKGFPVLSLAERELDKDIFNFTPGITCKFHEAKDSAQYCSLSIVKRWCFLISDHCCQDVGVALIPGSHVPLFSDTARACAMKRASEKEKRAASVSDGTLSPRSTGSSGTSRTKPTPTAITIIDYSKQPISDRETRRIKVSSSGEAVSRTRPVAEPPLRQPNSIPLAVIGQRLESPFTDADFPALGGEQGGVYGRLPVAVAGRGRGRTQEQIREYAVPSIGRGRGLMESLASMKI